MADNINNNPVKKSKKNVFILVVVLTITIIGTALITLKFVNVGIGQVSGAIVSEGVIPGYSAEQIQAMMQRKADESTFSFEINSRPIFENSKSEGTLRIYNPPYSLYNFDVQITLDSTGKTIFKSPILKPNQFIEKAKLSKKLEKGQHLATAVITAYSDTNELVGVTNAKLVITVEN